MKGLQSDHEISNVFSDQRKPICFVDPARIGDETSQRTEAFGLNRDSCFDLRKVWVLEEIIVVCHVKHQLGFTVAYSFQKKGDILKNTSFIQKKALNMDSRE